MMTRKMTFRFENLNMVDIVKLFIFVTATIHLLIDFLIDTKLPHNKGVANPNTSRNLSVVSCRKLGKATPIPVFSNPFKSADMKLPPKRWYKAMDFHYSKKYISQVVQDIQSTPGMEKEIKNFRDSFIQFAALERLHFEPDIVDELKCYYQRKRMFKWNIRKYYKLKNEVFERDKYTCQYCGAIGGILEMDHIIPFSKGGPDELNNLATACRKCNRKKKDKSVEEFLRIREEADHE